MMLAADEMEIVREDSSGGRCCQGQTQLLKRKAHVVGEEKLNPGRYVCVYFP